jgi:hypothetical protein
MADTGQGELMSIIALVISAGTILVGVVNHKRIRSNCCGRKAEASFDIESTTPPNMKSPLPPLNTPPPNPPSLVPIPPVDSN